MGKLVNTFSWSFSAAHDFEQCRRKRYWRKYAMWGGWEKDATEIQRKAYQMTKMDSIYSLQGNAVEESVMWVMRQKQACRDVTVDEAYENIARPLLNNAWKESKTGAWKQNPKRYCCLREHYYKEWDTAVEKEKTAAVIEHTKRCIANFIERTWPRLEHVKAEQEVAIAAKGVGDPESFELEGIKVYAIPDYVYRMDDQFHIHDWKSGKPRDEHKDQLALYGLWANRKHHVQPGSIFVYVEYLAEGKVAVGELGEEDLEAVTESIAASVADMADYLVDGDIRKNEPLPREEWDLALERAICSRCEFYELCEPELNAQA